MLDIPCQTCYHSSVLILMIHLVRFIHFYRKETPDCFPLTTRTAGPFTSSWSTASRRWLQAACCRRAASAPSVRQLSSELSINPNTVQRAYSELERDGIVYSVKGRGNFVTQDASLLQKSRQQELLEAVSPGLLLRPCRRAFPSLACTKLWRSFATRIDHLSPKRKEPLYDYSHQRFQAL